MFAGIVECVGRIVRVAEGGRPGGGETVAHQLTIAARPGFFDDLKLGASVAVNGVCLTLAERSGDDGVFDVVPETWQGTNLATLRNGEEVNLERSLRVGDPIDGHFVQGHVDATGTIVEIARDAGEYRIWIAAPESLHAYIVHKGSIAIDGVSLTIAAVALPRFAVALIPTTLAETALRNRKPGGVVNLESDILARLIIARLDALRGANGNPVTWATLRNAGFMS